MEEQKKPDVPVDRDIPSIPISPKGQRLAMIGVFSVMVLAIICVVAAGDKSSTDQPIVKHEEIVFKAPGKASEPYIKPDPLTPQAQSSPPPPAPDPLALQREQMMQAEALRMAQEQQKKLQKRLHAPQVVFDQPGTALAAASNVDGATSVNGGSLIGGDANDANLAFAAQATSQGVETSRAARMKNLDTLIAQGTMISGILETAIQSDLPGMTRAIVSEDVYSFDGSKLIIPKGSKLVGQYRSGLVRGQSRVFVIWNRLLRNDGVTVNLGSYGTDSLGRSGLDGKVDTHFFERFGSSVLLSLIDTSLQIVANNSQDSATSTVAVETGSDFSRAAEIALENSIAIPPTVNVEQGKRIKVFVSKDLDFSQVNGKLADAGAP